MMPGGLFLVLICSLWIHKETLNLGIQPGRYHEVVIWENILQKSSDKLVTHTPSASLSGKKHIVIISDVV